MNLGRIFSRKKTARRRTPLGSAALVRSARDHAVRARANGDFEGALSLLNDVIRYARDPKDVIAGYVAKADILAEDLNMVGKAVAHLDKALMYRPDDVAIQLRREALLLRR